VTDNPYKDRPWQPTTDAADLRHLGKLSEELGELSSAVARCIIQGVGECDPETGKPNRAWLGEEMADVIACVELAAVHFGISEADLTERIERKRALLAGWHSAP
jgi:hypothetical protein